MAFGDKLGDLVIFPNGVTESEATRERVKQAADLKAKFLSASHTNEIYSPPPDAFGQEFQLMPDPDTLDATWGTADESIYDDMGKNVLVYSSLREKQKARALSLNVEFIAGMKGDPESEAAREEVADAYEALNAWAEGRTAIRGLLSCYERGYSAAENIMGVFEFGRAKGLIGPVAMLNKPRKRFGFGYARHGSGARSRQPYFRPYGISQTNPQRIDDYKVTFFRAGSLETDYGAGFGPRCYPTVWKIDVLMKQFAAMTERFGYIPYEATYPSNWSHARADAEHRRLVRQWKNVVMVPGEVDGIKGKFADSSAAYAAANATGASILQQISKLETWLSFEIEGSQSSGGTQDTGSFAREKQASSDKWITAPSDAAVIEAGLNRGFVEPLMLVNRPTLERHKWPRCAIDSGDSEDLALLLTIIESASAMEFPVALTWFSERFKIPVAQDGEEVLAKKSVPASLAPNPNANTDPLARAEIMMAEPVINIARADGSVSQFHPDQSVYVKGKGIRRAALVRDDDVIVDDPKRFAHVRR